MEMECTPGTQALVPQQLSLIHIWKIRRTVCIQSWMDTRSYWAAVRIMLRRVNDSFRSSAEADVYKRQVLVVHKRH